MIVLNGDTGITTPTYGGTDTSEYLVPVTAFKNRLINGNMSVWQRGTSFSLSAGQTYTADRWITVISGSGSTSTLSQQAATPSDFASLEMQVPQFFTRYAVTVAGSVTYRDFAQRIEDVRTFAGQNATISFYAKAASSMTVGVQLYQGFGSGGSPDNSTTPVNVTIGTTWQRYTVTIACPSISGKTIGAGSMVAAVLIMPNTTFTFDVTMIQAEYGSTATSFDYRPYGTELALCQRYYQLKDGFQPIGSSTTLVEGGISYTEMRANPTIGQTAVFQIGYPGVADYNQSSIGITITASRVSTTGLMYMLSNFSGLTQGRAYCQNAGVNNAKITLSAEL
jgi:hypothetical protein